MTIKLFILSNRQGKVRLSKFWMATRSADDRRRVEADVHRTVATRSKRFTNFVEWQFEDHSLKIITRRYAGLHCTFGVDTDDNELMMMETIHLFVETLDQWFGNVCELDLVFNFNQVYRILDEFILAGEVSETSKPALLDRIRMLDRLE